MRFDGGGLWSVIRLSDNTTQTGAGPFSVDGLTIAVGGAPAVGDTFLVQPTASGAETLSVSINDTNEIEIGWRRCVYCPCTNLGTTLIGDRHFRTYGCGGCNLIGIIN